MNLVINYDFINAVLNVNENFTVKKLVRNNKDHWIMFNIPIVSVIEYFIAGNQFFNYMPLATAVHFFIIFQFELIEYGIFGDKYKDTSKERLMLLTSLLKDLDINTSYELLKDSKCYHKVRNIKIHNKCPQIIDSKYILVPNYDYKGDIVETSILQEHVLGTKTYTLSIGEPQKELKLVYSKV